MAPTIIGRNGALPFNPTTCDRAYVKGTITDNGSAVLCVPSVASSASVAWSPAPTCEQRRRLRRRGHANVLFISDTGTIGNYGTNRGVSNCSCGIDLAQGGVVTNGSTTA